MLIAVFITEMVILHKYVYLLFLLLLKCICADYLLFQLRCHRDVHVKLQVSGFLSSSV